MTSLRDSSIIRKPRTETTTEELELAEQTIITISYSTCTLTLRNETEKNLSERVKQITCVISLWNIKKIVCAIKEIEIPKVNLIKVVFWLVFALSSFGADHLSIIHKSTIQINQNMFVRRSHVHLCQSKMSYFLANKTKKKYCKSIPRHERTLSCENLLL